jgi:broad specificity phosphatase PhoE
LIIIRHGRTEWNREERFRGRADIALDEVGKKQAEATAGRVAEWQVNAIYSSPLRRAMETAQTLARSSGLEVRALPDIIDIDYGQWQGLLPEEAEAKDGGLYKKWLRNPHQVKFPGGESLAEVRDRAAAAIDKLIAQHDKETIALVSHKVVCQVMVLSLLGLELSHFWDVVQDVCAVNYFEVRGGIPSALLINDTCHLEGLS